MVIDGGSEAHLSDWCMIHPVVAAREQRWASARWRSHVVARPWWAGEVARSDRHRVDRLSDGGREQLDAVDLYRTLLDLVIAELDLEEAPATEHQPAATSVVDDDTAIHLRSGDHRPRRQLHPRRHPAWGTSVGTAEGVGC